MLTCAHTAVALSLSAEGHADVRHNLQPDKRTSTDVCDSRTNVARAMQYLALSTVPDVTGDAVHVACMSIMLTSSHRPALHTLWTRQGYRSLDLGILTPRSSRLDIFNGDIRAIFELVIQNSSCCVWSEFASSHQ
jgi:hypothetical protein